MYASTDFNCLDGSQGVASNNKIQKKTIKTYGKKSTRTVLVQDEAAVFKQEDPFQDLVRQEFGRWRKEASPQVEPEPKKDLTEELEWNPSSSTETTPQQVQPLPTRQRKTRPQRARHVIPCEFDLKNEVRLRQALPGLEKLTVKPLASRQRRQKMKESPLICFSSDEESLEEKAPLAIETESETKTQILAVEEEKKENAVLVPSSSTRETEKEKDSLSRYPIPPPPPSPVVYRPLDTPKRTIASPIGAHTNQHVPLLLSTSNTRASLVQHSPGWRATFDSKPLAASTPIATLPREKSLIDLSPVSPVRVEQAESEAQVDDDDRQGLLAPTKEEDSPSQKSSSWRTFGFEKALQRGLPLWNKNSPETEKLLGEDEVEGEWEDADKGQFRLVQDHPSPRRSSFPSIHLCQPHLPTQQLSNQLEYAFDRLALQDDTAQAVSETVTLEQLLKSCNQIEPLAFDQFTSSCLRGRLAKIGEATFSEVFSATIELPFRPSHVFHQHTFKEASAEVTECVQTVRTAIKVLAFGSDPSVLVNGEAQTSLSAAYQEIRITQSLLELSSVSTHNFVQTYGIVIVKGRYPTPLLRAWDAWDTKNESENDRPDVFSDQQLFAILLLEYGGPDLEHTELQSWDQAISIVQQLTLSLSAAEHHLSFEHRDLHWGNILIQDLSQTEEPTLTYVVQTSSEDPPDQYTLFHRGVRCCIIDFTFSRLTLPGTVSQKPLTFFRAYDDEGYFEGEGDYQFDMYRRMRDLVRKESTETKNNSNLNWSGFHPKTNVYWLHYVIDKLLSGVTYREDQRRKRASSRKPSRRSKMMPQQAECNNEAKLFLKELHARLLMYRDVREVLLHETDLFTIF